MRSLLGFMPRAPAFWVRRRSFGRDIRHSVDPRPARSGCLTEAQLSFRKESFPMRRTLFVGLTWLLLCAPCFAQTLGTITGEVRDTTDAVVPGVTVTVVNTATNATRTTLSNAVALFDFPALQPGTYSDQ